MHRSVFDTIRRHVEKRGRGVVFVTRDMLGFGSRAAVDEALSRLAKEGVVRRLGRGLYYYPRLHPTLGPVPADPDEIAAALTRKNGARLQASGARAANALGLSVQVPSRPVYLTDGRPRTIQVGGQTIELRHVAPRAMAGSGRTEGAVIQALRHLGPEQVDAATVERLRQALTAREKAALRREALNAPGWLVPILQEVARSETRGGASKADGNRAHGSKSPAAPEGTVALEPSDEAPS